MKIVIASLLACALSLNAQITATLNRLSDGSIEISVRNNSAVTLTAFAVKVNHSQKDDASLRVYIDPDTVYVDAAIDTAMQPLKPNQEYTFKPRLRSSRGGPSPLQQVLSGERKQRYLDVVNLSEHTIMTVGAFADGTTTGDPGLLTRLMLRRSNMLLAVETTLEILFDAGRRNVAQDHLIGRFKELADSARRSYLLPEQRVGLDLYQSMIGKLLNLPHPNNGSPFPPNEFVVQETTILRQQRVRLSESEPSLFSFANSVPNSK